MDQKEIEDRYNLAMQHLQVLEGVCKESSANFQTHLERFNRLKFLASRLAELRSMELALLQQASQAASQLQPQPADEESSLDE